MSPALWIGVQHDCVMRLPLLMNVGSHFCG